MVDSLAASTALACVVLGLVVAGRSLAGATWLSLLPLLVVLEVALVGQAVVAAVGIVRGHHPREPAPLAAYLVLLATLLPGAAAFARREESRWSGAVVAVALLGLAVVVVRAVTTWRPA